MFMFFLYGSMGMTAKMNELFGDVEPQLTRRLRLTTPSFVQDAEECVSIRFNPLRAGFKRAEGAPDAVDTFCPDVLNTGVK